VVLGERREHEAEQARQRRDERSGNDRGVDPHPGGQRSGEDPADRGRRLHERPQDREHPAAQLGWDDPHPKGLEANAHLEAGDATAALTAAAGIPMRVIGSATGPRVEPAGIGLDAALGALLAAASTATADGSWQRLKVCRNDACRWAYWDASRNRSGVWCTMAVCGNRAKGRSFRQRHAGA
jgi:predicted RNA-binding Zn ribbon-like protein